MELEENNISGILPSEIGNLHQLEYLDLSWNTLQASSIPWEFQGLRNLKELFLKSNDLGGSLPTILGVMSNLESLVLSLNAFTGEIPSVVNHLSSLCKYHTSTGQYLCLATRVYLSLTNETLLSRSYPPSGRQQVNWYNSTGDWILLLTS